MKKPHKHAEMIKAWADGEAIQYRNDPCDEWHDLASNYPSWIPGCEFRIKPEPKPDVVRYLNPNQYNGSHKYFEEATVRAVFDGQTGELKSVGKVK